MSSTAPTTEFSMANMRTRLGMFTFHPFTNLSVQELPVTSHHHLPAIRSQGTPFSYIFLHHLQALAEEMKQEKVRVSALDILHNPRPRNTRFHVNAQNFPYLWVGDKHKFAALDLNIANYYENMARLQAYYRNSNVEQMTLYLVPVYTSGTMIGQVYGVPNVTLPDLFNRLCEQWYPIPKSSAVAQLVVPDIIAPSPVIVAQSQPMSYHEDVIKLVSSHQFTPLNSNKRIVDQVRTTSIMLKNIRFVPSIEATKISTREIKDATMEKTVKAILKAVDGPEDDTEHAIMMYNHFIAEITKGRGDGAMLGTLTSKVNQGARMVYWLCEKVREHRPGVNLDIVSLLLASNKLPFLTYYVQLFKSGDGNQHSTVSQRLGNLWDFFNQHVRLWAKRLGLSKDDNVQEELNDVLNFLNDRRIYYQGHDRNEAVHRRIRADAQGAEITDRRGVSVEALELVPPWHMLKLASKWLDRACSVHNLKSMDPQRAEKLCQGSLLAQGLLRGMDQRAHFWAEIGTWNTKTFGWLLDVKQGHEKAVEFIKMCIEYSTLKVGCRPP